jgi:hypothetical protein
MGTGFTGWRRAAVWLAPVLLIGTVLHLAVLPLAYKARVLEKAVMLGRGNVYESSWLDSVRAELSDQIIEMQEYVNDINKRISGFNSLQLTADQVRTLFTESGLSVVRIQPFAADSGQLRLTTVRVEGVTDFSGLYVLFTSLSDRYPQYSIERMNVRKSRQGLNFSILLTAYTSPKRD